MADAPQTSFIPKKSMGSTPQRVAPRKNFSVFNFIATVVFLGALALSVGVFFYKNFSNDTLNEAKNTLADIKNSFDQSNIESLRELDKRLSTASVLLDNHLSPLAVFDMLERRTQSDTQFTSFLYTKNESGSVALDLGGLALQFPTLVLQGRQLEQDALFESIIFSDIDVITTEEGGASPQGRQITFTATGMLDTDIIRYTAPALPDPPEGSADTAGAEGISEDTSGVPVEEPLE